MYRYYLTQRPASPGAFPAADDNPPEEVHNYDCRTFVPEIQCLAWGYVEYRRPLELYDVSIYELMEAPTGEGIMEDQNGRKILTGDVVRVTGAQPKADNGLFFVERSPRDPNWEPEMYCLMRLCENGRLSSAARNIAYWPNPNGQADTAKIEVLPDFRALDGLIRHFKEEIKLTNEQERREKASKRKNFDGSWIEGYCAALRTHYEAVIERIRSRMEGSA